MLHTELVSRLRGILNREWAVLPPGILLAATPEEAVASAMRPRERMLASNAMYKNVFLVPLTIYEEDARTIIVYMLHDLIVCVFLVKIKGISGT